IEGTFRTMNEEWRFEAHRQMKKMAEQMAESMGGHCDFEIAVGYPTLYNDEELTFKARSFAEAYLGSENVVDLPMRMSAEDFSYYSQVMPACFYRLGTGNIERGITSNVHTPTFDIDESALKVGVGLMAWMAVCSLNES
ncbi:MAG: M20/M25/M40 family metallo-hydrolase, partial [Bacteroidota bacterium]